jgi:glucan phosphoethanolaminetransferase (alkaline phosphatase superfamily)
MTEYTVETTKKENSQSKRIIYYILGIIEVLLAFRLVFKILGANPASGFVSFIYTVTGIFLTPFNAIFRTASTQGIETSAVLEPSTIIAMVVYALIAWGIVELFIAFKGRREEKH